MSLRRLIQNSKPLAGCQPNLRHNTPKNWSTGFLLSERHNYEQPTPPNRCFAPRQAPLYNSCIGQPHVHSCAASLCAPHCVLSSFEFQLDTIIWNCTVSFRIPAFCLSFSPFVSSSVVSHGTISITLICCGNRGSHLLSASTSIRVWLPLRFREQKHQSLALPGPCAPEAASTPFLEVLQDSGYSVGPGSSFPTSCASPSLLLGLHRASHVRPSRTFSAQSLAACHLL